MKKLLFMMSFLAVVFIQSAIAYAAVDAYTAVFSVSLENEDGAVILDRDDAEIQFAVSEETLIYLNFDEPVWFSDENAARIVTNMPVQGIEDARSSNSIIRAFLIDGRETGFGGTTAVSYLPNFETRGFLSIEMHPEELASLEPFTTMEIRFFVGNPPIGIADAPFFEPESIIEETVQETAETQETTEETPERTSTSAPFIVIAVLMIIVVVVIIGARKKFVGD